MDKFDRFQELHRLFLSRKRPVPIRVLAERMECSEKTVSRTIHQMRDFLDAPIEYLENQGWHYAQSPGERFQLPGLWLTAAELQSLTSLLHVLEDFGSGLLSEELKVVEREIHRLLQARGIAPDALMQHIKVLPLGNRQLPSKVFMQVVEALLNKRRITLRYRSFDQEISNRTVSPQHLIYYRENWYLDAWCHLRDDLRTFSLARMEKLTTTDSFTRRVPEQQLRDHFTGSYGLFAGKARHLAKLRFFSKIAYEITMQQWHEEQQGQWEGEEYLLTFPYGRSDELISDILRYVPYVAVESPKELRDKVKAALTSGLEVFKQPAR